MQKNKIEEMIVKNTIAIRKKNKKTQRDVANALKVSPGYVGQVESVNSPSMYTYDQLNKLAIYLECSLKDFMPQEPVKE